MGVDEALVGEGSVADALLALARAGETVALDVRSGKKRWIFYLDDGALVSTRSNLKREQADAIREAAEDELSDEAVARQAAALRLQRAERTRETTRKPHAGAQPKTRETLGLAEVIGSVWAMDQGTEAVVEATRKLVAAWPRKVKELDTRLWTPGVAAWLEAMDGQRSGDDVLRDAPEGREDGLVVFAQAERMGLIIAGEAPQAVDAAGLPQLDLGSLLADIKEDTGPLDGGPESSEDPESTDRGRYAHGLGRQPEAKVVSVDVPAEHAMAGVLTSLGPRIEEAENHFQVLDMPWDANPSSFRSAYMTLAQQLHPDRHADAPPVLQERATALFDKVREAWEVLGDDAKRQAYIDKVIHGKKTEEELAMEQIQAYWSAEADFKRGLAAFKNGRISQAHVAFQKATNAVPDELEWKAYAAFTTFHSLKAKDPQKAEDAVEIIKNVLEANKAQERKLDSGWVLLGRTYRDRDMPEAARRCFVQALRYNPSNADAQLEMKRIKGAAAKDKKGGGFFGKLFGKKK